MSQPETWPPHIARPTGALVGPLVWFRGQPVAVTSSPPRDTLDPRYNACTDHRLACDCREGSRAEEIAEYREELQHLRTVLTGMITGHPTEVYLERQRRRDLECRCQLCEFARTVHLVPLANQHAHRSMH